MNLSFLIRKKSPLFHEVDFLSLSLHCIFEPSLRQVYELDFTTCIQEKEIYLQEEEIISYEELKKRMWKDGLCMQKFKEKRSIEKTESVEK